MIYSAERDQIRQFYFDCWQKHLTSLPLSAEESRVVQVILQHPEYHTFLKLPEQALSAHFHASLGETNPFLHMGLHLALQEQIQTDRPAGIRTIYQRLLQTHTDPHAVEHNMIEILAECLWQAQRHNTLPDEVDYLAKLQKL